MLQSERQRLKDLGQELQVRRKVLRVGRDRRNKRFLGGDGRMEGN